MFDQNPLLPTIESVFATPGPSWTEFALIQLLKERGLLEPGYSQSSLELFQVHFCVFNALYQLQDRLAEKGDLALVISPLEIYSRPTTPDENARAVTQQDDQPLRDYYLNWDHYHKATGESVDGLLDDFWRRFARHASLGKDERQQALSELELEDPVSPTQIKQQYRRLAMVHHPDRGGSTERLRRINAAMAVLENRP